jgi:hypothetical protein
MTFENQNNRVDSKPALGNFFNEHDKKKHQHTQSIEIEFKQEIVRFDIRR